MNKDELISSLRQKGFSEQIISSFRNVKREDFVPEHLIGYAYEDIALPVMEGSTISQPSTIAFMLNLLELKENHKVLEIGSGSGYVLALLSEIIKIGNVYGVEIIKEVAIRAKEYLKDKQNLQIIIRNGFNGLPEFAPYDRILVSASCPEIPKHLLEQLKDDGILVACVKQSIFQIKKVKNRETGTEETTIKEYPGFVFVPLIEGE